MRLTASALLFLMLAGCSGIGWIDSGSGQQPKQIVSSSELQTALDPRRNGAARQREGQAVPEIAPAALIGTSGSQVEVWMGSPDALWTEGGHALWRYASGDCVVLLFVDPGDTVRKVNVLRQDGKGSDGCDRAISDRVSGAQTS